eukprot:TRINITY_DN617_c0_g1_i10.p3 TRINITY_DN617_c0_g1~~TRINITY_DN617_c0_g1_i10.p3  ORF type:complete len:50 (+),score=11.94 TRINITY_DN617_c0_g1_i10:384-533(+)
MLMRAIVILRIKTAVMEHQSVNNNSISLCPHVLCVDTGRSSETAKAHRG